LEESAFLELVLDAVMVKHLAEIRSDPEIWAAILERDFPGELGEV